MFPRARHYRAEGVRKSRGKEKRKRQKGGRSTPSPCRRIGRGEKVFHPESPFLLKAYKKDLPMNEYVQGQVFNGLRCHLDCFRRRKPLCGMPTHPRPVTGAPVEPYWMKFFRIRPQRPICPRRISAGISASPALCERARWFYFRLNGLMSCSITPSLNHIWPKMQERFSRNRRSPRDGGFRNPTQAV